VKCEIQWIDDAGKPTPDTNEAVARIVCDAHTVIDRRTLYPTAKIPASRHYACCAGHLKQMPDNWTVVETFAEELLVSL